MPFVCGLFYSISLAREEIDNPHKKKAQKVFRENFSIQMTFEKVEKPDKSHVESYKPVENDVVLGNGSRPNGVEIPPVDTEPPPKVEENNVHIKVEEVA